jgi:hypothetical protein
MNQELIDFQHFKEHQLHSIDYQTGEIIAKGGKGGNRIYKDIGSKNLDGYVRLWCNGHLRMKHRLVYFLYHGVIPQIGEEIDHIDRVRDNNCVENLRIVTKSVNNTGTVFIKKKQFSTEVIKKACELLQNTSLSDLVIAEQTGMSRSSVRQIKTRTKRQTIASAYSWLHRGY